MVRKLPLFNEQFDLIVGVIYAIIPVINGLLYQEKKMCNRFLQYLEKQFSCFGQDVNEDNSAEERSDRDDDHSSSQSENSSSERESFKSYSDDDDEEGAGEDVVESTGRNGTRYSSYEDYYSMGSTTNSIRNVESLKSFNGPSRKNSPEEKKNKYVPVEIRSKVGSQKINQEIPEKLSKSDTRHAKQTRQQPEGRKVSSKTATTTLMKEDTKNKTDTKLSNKAPTAKKNKNLKKKDDKEAVGKQIGKITPVGEKKSSLKSKAEKKNFGPKSVDKPKEKLEKERKSPPKEKRKTEEVKQSGKHLEAVIESSKKLKSKSNKTEKMNSIPLQNKTVTNKKLEPKMPKNGLKKNNISRAGTFAKRSRSLPGRGVPKFTSKSIHKRRLTK